MLNTNGMMPGQSSFDLSSVEDITTLKLLGDLVLVDIDELETETSSGIIIPESAAAEMIGDTLTGTVVSVGTEGDPELVIGTRVLIHRIAGDYMTVGQSEYRCVPSVEILCLVVDDES
jgi:co-chaperonin GroES (HSP10)